MVRTEGLQQNNGGIKEALGQSLYEVRFADLERDISAVASLFNQPSVMEHLAGIAPAVTPRDIDVKKFRIKNPQFGILIATEQEIKQYYVESTRSKLLVATDADSKVVGTVTVETPGMGLTFGGVSRIAVSDEVRGQGVGRKLLKAANAFIFSKPKDGGLGCLASQAGIIKVRGQEIPLGLFGSEGYRQGSELKDNCKSWSNEENKFVNRSVIPVRLEVAGREPRVDLADLPKAI